MSFEIIVVPVGSDNYSYLLISNNTAAVVDCSDSAAMFIAINKYNCKITYIFSTHHHSDHVNGNLYLKEKYPCSVVGGDPRIPGLDTIVTDNEFVNFSDISIKVLSVPGHTKKQVAYYIESYRALFTGDTLFGAGCGRIFECGPEQLYNSLVKLSNLPDNTNIYFGHEYTLENLEFASEIEPDNEAIFERKESVKSQLKQGLYSTPSTLLIEKQTNPFLRVNSKSIRKRLHMEGRSPIAVFTELRRLKDRF